MSASRLDIRPALLEDLPHLTALYTHLNPSDPPCPPETAAEALGSINAFKGSAVLIGVLDGILVTSCTVFVLPNLTRGGDPYALIENVVTHSDFRNRGFGKAILKAASQQAFGAGCYKAMLLTGLKQPETLSFYKSARFVQDKTGFQIRNIPVSPE